MTYLIVAVVCALIGLALGYCIRAALAQDCSLGIHEKAAARQAEHGRLHVDGL